MDRISRRQLIVSGALAAGALAGSRACSGRRSPLPRARGSSPYGPLGAPDANGLMLPPGFSSREIARGLSEVKGYPWPVFPDGQATFPTADGGWILVTNSESLSVSGAGTSGIRFRPDGAIDSAYRILAGTNVNCARRRHAVGHLAVVRGARGRPRLGVRSGGDAHRAAAAGARRVQPRGGGDRAGRPAAVPHRGPAGRRLLPLHADLYPDLSEGLLEVAVVAADNTVSWRALPNPTPTPAETPTRKQVPEMTPFNGGEGIWHDGGILYFTTKGDARVWAYDSRTSTIEVLYDHAAAPDASLDAVDNITVSAAGEIFVCEDGGNMEIGLITPEREVSPFLRFTGPAHPVEGQFKSEVCGVIFDPSGTRMYCTSQRSYPPSPDHARAGRGLRDQRALQAPGDGRARQPVRAARGRAQGRAAPPGRRRAAGQDRAPDRAAARCSAAVSRSR